MPRRAAAAKFSAFMVLESVSHVCFALVSFASKQRSSAVSEKATLPAAAFLAYTVSTQVGSGDGSVA